MIDENTKKRFWAKVVKGSANDDCWSWSGSKSLGYGQLYKAVGESPWKAHRLSFILHNGEIPDGLHILHKCDNPECSNPDHLWAGTHRENMDDMTTKGRASKKPLHGEENGQSKITWDDAKEIRKMYGNVPSYEISKKYGVCRGQIKNIAQNKSWHDPEYTPSGKDGNSAPRPHLRVVSDETLKEMIEIRRSGLSYRKIAKMFGVSKPTVMKYIKGSEQCTKS